MVAECFNDFFINVAKDIGSETAADKNHPSIAAMYLFWSSACFQSSIHFSSVVWQP
jgi:hypothetical protein